MKFNNLKSIEKKLESCISHSLISVCDLLLTWSVLEEAGVGCSQYTKAPQRTVHECMCLSWVEDLSQDLQGQHTQFWVEHPVSWAYSAASFSTGLLHLGETSQIKADLAQMFRKSGNCGWHEQSWLLSLPGLPSLLLHGVLVCWRRPHLATWWLRLPLLQHSLIPCFLFYHKLILFHLSRLLDKVKQQNWGLKMLHRLGNSVCWSTI